jgi:nickel-dependent lactate racemase
VIGLNFIVNTIMNSDGELIAAFAGHFLQAHRAGVARAMGVFGVPFTELADLTISSTSPVDFDFFQADKGIFAAELATRRHGEIVLMSGCTEGLSGSHSDLADYGNLDDQTIWEHVKSGKAKDPLTAAEALALNHIKRLFRVTVVSDGFTARMAQDMGYHHVDPGKFSSYLSRRLSENPNIRLGVLRRSAEILPQFTG